MENSTPISVEQVSELSARVIQEVEKAVVGKLEVLQLMMADGATGCDVSAA